MPEDEVNVQEKQNMSFGMLRDNIIGLMNQGFESGLKSDEVLAAVFVAYKMAESNFDVVMRKMMEGP